MPAVPGPLRGQADPLCRRRCRCAFAALEALSSPADEAEAARHAPHFLEIAACVAPIQRDTDPPGDLAAMDRFTLAVADNLSYNAQFILPKGAAADLLR